ncbi:hypothetical protein BDK51DRAFT_17575, partial [Blyttiomyces helicus]
MLRHHTAKNLGLKIEDIHSIKDCRPCIQAKMSQKSFPKVPRTRASEPRERIHTDLCGPLPVGSLGAKYYFQTFVEDYT